MPERSDRTKILAILFVILLGFVVFFYESNGQAPPHSSTTSSVRTTTTSTPPSSSVNWANLRGVNYNWPSVRAGSAPSPPPSVSFPLMVADGFNFIRVPLSISLAQSNLSAFIPALTTLANAADSYGLSVVYLQSDWDVGAQSTWASIMSTFWQPVIGVVDSHPSTIGYEPVNEPSVGGSTLQAYNQYFSTQIRALSDKAIVLGSSNDDGSPSSGIMPTGVSNLVITVHSYGGNPSNAFAGWASTAASMGVPVLLGEFGPCAVTPCGIAPSDAQSSINTYVQAAHAYGFAMAYWFWGCADPGSSGSYNPQPLLATACDGAANPVLNYLTSAYTG